MAVTWLTGGSHVDTLTAPKIHTHCARTHTCVCLHSEAINVPMIPLGLKETKEVDFTLSIQVKTRSRLSFKLHQHSKQQSSHNVRCNKIKWEGKKAIECLSIASRWSLALGYSEQCLQPEQTSDLQEGCSTGEEQNN